MKERELKLVPIWNKSIDFDIPTNSLWILQILSRPPPLGLLYVLSLSKEDD